MLDSRVLSSTAETLDGCGSGPSAKPSLGCIIFFFFFKFQLDWSLGT